MDDLKKRVSESLQVKLSVTLLLVIFTVATLAGVFSFLSAFEEAHELQDDVLQQIAQLMDRQHLWPASPIVGASLKNSDEQSRVIVQNIGDARLVPTTQAARTQLELPIKLSDGLHTLKSKGEVFRVLVKTTSFGQRIAVAQAASFRNEIARDSALRTAMPLLILVPVLLLIVADLVRKTLRPIAALSREIDQRTEQELHPVQANHLPIEIRPLAVAINRLLDRTNKAMDAQRRFLASAAHELRSPLTALSLQAQRLSAAQMSDQQAHERLAILHQGINRSRNLLDQMFWHWPKPSHRLTSPKRWCLSKIFIVAY